MMVYNSHNGKVKIIDEVYHTLRNLIKGQVTEIGGTIYGRYICDSNDIVVDGITLPQVKDVKLRNLFIRKDKNHILFLKKMWERTNQTVAFLGDWHSHLACRAVPSPTDVKSWIKTTKRIGKDKILIFVIVAKEEIGIWETFLDKDEVIIRKLEVIMD